jgi:diguanylate cyclase (GGDEF)-like protein
MNRIFAKYINKQLFAGILRFILAAIYISLFAASIWLCRDFSPGYIIDRIVPYGIPPLLTLLSAAFLSLFVLTLEQTRTETFLFSIICLVFAGLNLDIFLLGIITDPHIALFISRVDHFMLALVQLGANLHLAYLVCEKKDNWWIVYLSYGIGVIMALFTPTNLYFQGIYTYYWGFFAKKAIMYDLMSTLWMAATIYCIFILFQSYRQTSDAHKKDTIKFLLLGFVCTAVLSLTNTPAMYGHEVYPLGTFTFISLFLLAYGLFKYNLRIALQQLRTVLSTVGHMAIILAAAFIPYLFLPPEMLQLKLISGIVLVALLYHPVYKIWDLFLNLFIKRSSNMLQKELYVLIYKLSERQHLKDIHQEICHWLFKLFMNSRCAMIFADTDDIAYKGWHTMNPNPSSGFFSKPANIPVGDAPLSISASHPILKKIAAEHARLVTRAMIDRWMDALQLINDPEDKLQQAGAIIPIYSQSRLLSLVLIGNKINDRSYSKPEKVIFENIGAVLGPFIENAKLLEGLERKVENRTRDLNKALEKVKQNNKKISKNSAIIKKQNHIFLSFFETSTRIHDIEELHELFADTLNQLRSLFPRFGFGIIHEGERSEVIESGAFIGISEKEQTVILENRQHLTRHNINQVLINKLPAFDAGPEIQEPYWTVLPMRIGDNRIIGKIIIKGPRMDQMTNKVISIFLAQVSAAAHNKILMRKLETTANTDGMTGIANRAFFDQRLKTTIKNSDLFPGIYFSILMIDINGLKRVNDNFGHDKGDEMIKCVADMLSSICRETDTLSRMGGDEFIILLASTSSIQAKAAVDRIRQKEKELFLVFPKKNHEKISIPIRFSIGVAGSDEVLPEKVMKLADQRMYIDKENFYQNTIDNLHSGHS